MSGGHGHVVPRPDGVKARCGGPALCGVCAKELAAQSATVTAQEPGQAAAHAFVAGCVQRGITASMAAVPPEGQLATVRGLWADVAQAVVDAATEGSLRACGYTLADVGRFLEAEAAAQQPQPAPPEVQFAPCPVEGHDGKHMQWRSGQWTCGHVLANSLILGGILPVPPERPAPALAALRSGIAGLAADLDRSAAETRPSRKSEIESETAIALRRLLETP